MLLRKLGAILLQESAIFMSFFLAFEFCEPALIWIEQSFGALKIGYSLLHWLGLHFHRGTRLYSPYTTNTN
jgi:hypothetical protein